MNESDAMAVRDAAACDFRDDLVTRVAHKTGASEATLAALRRVARHRFLPESVGLSDAYRDGPFPIGHGQTISQPTVVAMMTDALGLTGREKVLEIGTGSGYQTAVLAELCQDVFTVEVVPILGERARGILEGLGYANIHFRVGDGYVGWPEQAPFDRILLTAAPREVPRTLIAQLREDGCLVAPVGEHLAQRLVRITPGREGEPDHEVFLGSVAFVPMVHARPS